MRGSKQVDILNGPIYKQMVLFFIPIIIGSIFQQVYNTTDAIIVGNFVGKQALAAVGGTPAVLYNLFTGFAIGLSSGASVIISQYFGAHESEKMSKAVHSSIWFSIVLGIVMMISIELLAQSILSALQVPADIFADSMLYLRIAFVGLVPSLIYNMGTAVLRAVGDTKRPLYFLIVSCILNIFLDIYFVLMLHMGVAGVAIATVIAQIISACLVMYSLTHTDLDYQVRVREIQNDNEMLLQIVKIGIPAGVQSVLYSLSNLVIQSSINSLGTDSVAAWTAYGKIDSLFWMMIGAFGVTITTFAAQSFGAKKYDRVRESIKAAFVITFISTILLSIVLFIFGENLYYLFTTDQVVIKIGTDILKFLVPFYVTFVPIEIISGALRGMGDAFYPTVITTIGVCALRILWVVVIFTAYPTLLNVLSCYPITWSCTSILFIIYYFWKNPLRKAMH